MSRTIDERVVEMRFDNKQFESGVKQSMSTLDRLKQALNFSTSEKSLQNLNAAAKNVSLDGIAAGVDALQKRFSTLGIVGMRAIENLTDSVMGTLGRAINFMNDAIISGGIRRAMNLENAHFQLQSIIGDEERVQEVMDTASKSVDGTAYSFDVAAKAASQMTASGITDIGDLGLALRGLAGTTATFSADYEQMSMIFTQVAGQGRLMGDQLLQLSTRGANAAVTIADFVNAVNSGSVDVSDSVRASVRAISTGTKVTEADIRELVSKGKVDFNAFAGAMNYAFGDSAEKANETFTGALANIKSAFARIGEGFVKPLVAQNSSVVELFNSIRMKVNDVKSALVFNEELGNVHALSKQFSDAMLSMAKGASEFITGFDITKPMELFYYGVEIIKNALKGLWSFIGPLGKAFAEVFLSFDGDMVINFASAIETLTANLRFNEHGMKGLHDAAKGVLDVIKLVIDSVFLLIGAFTGLSVPISVSADGLFDFIGYLGRCLSEMVLWLRTSPQMVAIFNAIQKAVSYMNDAIAYAAKWFGILWDEIVALQIPQEIMERLMKAFEKLNTIASPYIAEAVEQLKAFKKHLEEVVPERFETLIDDIYRGFVDIKLAVMGVDLSPVTKMFSKLQEVMQKLVDTVKGNEGFMTFVTNAKKFAQEMKTAFTFDKLLDNLKKFMEFVGEFAKWVKNTVGPLFGDFSIGGAVAGGAGVAMVYSLIKVAKAFEKLSGTIQKIPNIFGSLGGALKAWQQELKAKALKEIATALLILVGALVVLSFADMGKVMQAAVALSLVSGVMLAGISKLLNVANKGKTANDALFQVAKGLKKAIRDVGKAIKIKAFASAIKSFAMSIAIVTASIIAIAVAYKKDSASMNQALKIIGIISGVMIGVIAGMSILGDALDKGMANFAKAGLGILALSFALSMAISALSRLFKMELPSDANTKLTILITLFGVLGLLAVAIGATSAIAGGNSIKSGPILALTAMLYVSVLSLQKLFSMDLPGDWGIKVGILAGIFVALGALMIAVGYANKLAGGSLKAMGSILAMCVFIGVVVAALMVLQLVPGMGLLKGATALGLVLVALGAALYGAAQISDENTYKSVLAMAVVVGAITAALGVLSIVPLPMLAKSATVLGAMLLALALDFLAISKVTDENAFKNILAMTAMVVLIATSLYVLAEQPWDALLSAGVSMTGVLLAFSLAMKVISEAEGIDIQKIGLFLLATLAVVPIGAALYILAEQDWPGMLAAGTALTATMLAFTLAFKVISDAEGINLEKIMLFLAASIAVLPIAVSLSELARHPWENMLAAAGSLSATLLAFSLSFSLISKAQPNLVAIAAFLAGSAGIALIAYSIYELSQQPWQNLLGAAGAIALVLTAMGVAMAICSAVGMAAPAAIAGIATLDLFIANFALLLVALGKIFEDPATKNLLGGGSSVLAQIGDALGGFVGSIVNGFLGSFSSSLPKIGQDLSDFMNAADPFFKGVKDVDARAMDGVKSMAEAILVLTGTSIIQGLTSWLTGGSTLVKFGEELEEFAPHFANYYETIKDVDGSVVQSSANAAKALAEMADTLPDSGGLKAKIFGDSSLTAFGEELEKFGPHISKYAQSVNGLDPAVVEASAKAAQVMADMASTLPDSGGLKAKIFGDNSLAQFGEELAKFGPHIAAYSDHVAGVDANVVVASANAAKALSELAADLPNEGGLLSLFTGDNDIGTFGANLEKFGIAFKAYYDQISGLDTGKLAAVTYQVQRIVELAKGINEIDTSGMLSFSKNLEAMAKNGIDGFIKAFDDSYSKVTETVKKFVDKISTELTNLSKKISTASTELSNSLTKGLQTGITSQQSNVLETIRTLSTQMISTLRESLPQSTFNQIAQQCIQAFINGINAKKPLLLSTIKNLCASLINTMRASLPSTTFNNIGQSVVQGLINGINAKRPALLNTVQQLCYAVVQKFKTELAPTKFEEIGKEIVKGLARGIEAEKSSATSAAKRVADAVYRAFKDNMSPSKFKEIGENAALGLKKGIESKINEIRDAAIRAAKKAIEAAKAALRENSPSKVFFEMGEYVSIGLANGIVDKLNTVDRAGTLLGEEAIKSMSKTIGAINDAINEGDIDTDVVIRPKLDLTETRKGYSEIQEMFNRNFDISVAYNRAIDTSNAVARTMQSKAASENENTGKTGNVIHNNYNMEQNNYSPKALSRSEIYRDTRNLFSSMKERSEKTS